MSAPIDLTGVALTIVVGVGGVVALVIAYRRQRDLEQSRFVERFGAAAAQLGATDVAVRIAGVYAMAGIADETDGLRRQQCIDVLCGYLRLPYSPALGDSHRDELVLDDRRVSVDSIPVDDRGHRLEYRHNDREVRVTIIRLIAEHLRISAEYSWSTSNFDFRSAYLEDVDFNRTVFSGIARFDGVTFSGTTTFARVTFSGTTVFDGAMFSGAAWFDGSIFSDTTWFGDVTFSDDVSFRGATFSGAASFCGVTFPDPPRFDATSGSVTFSGAAVFDGATFSSTTCHTCLAADKGRESEASAPTRLGSGKC
ncbi:pentapeptide repeat-containing protein [Nocardia aurea]|uniref:Pentapeptide repeat-containing protein n=1 Tax=Nocardia aurea TaxID=2144174 RepID=A0ABV3G319_9NOCA